MAAVAKVKQQNEEENRRLFAEGVQVQKIKDCAFQYVQNHEISKERADENIMLKEDIAQFLGDSLEPFVVEMPSGEFIVMRKTRRNSETLDKDMLSHLSKIDKDEFKTPLDYAMLIKQGKITTEMIKESTVVNSSESVSIRVLKNNPLKSKRKKKAFA